MVLGIGCDILEIARIKKAIEKDHFLSRYFSSGEISLIQKKGASAAAGNFSAKEAMVKALGTGFGKIMPKDIEVLRGPLGKPYINLHGPAKEFFDEINGGNIFLSISHTADHAIAYVVIEKVPTCIRAL